MDFIKQKIRVMTEKLDEIKTVKSEAVTYSFVECPEYKTSNTPPAEEASWQDFVPNKNTYYFQAHMEESQCNDHN